MGAQNSACQALGLLWGWFLGLASCVATCLCCWFGHWDLNCPLKNGVLPLCPETGVQNGCALVPGKGSVVWPQGAAALISHPRESLLIQASWQVGCGSAGSHLWGQPSLLPAVPLVTSHSSSLHHSFLQGCCGMERLMNKSIPLSAEAAKLGCEQRSSAGAGILKARVAPLVNSPHAAAADRAACSQVGSSDCLLAMFYLSKHSICRLPPAVPHSSWILLPGKGSSGLERSREVLLAWGAPFPLPPHGGFP